MYRDQFGEFVCGYWGIKQPVTREEFGNYYIKGQCSERSTLTMKFSLDKKWRLPSYLKYKVTSLFRIHLKTKKNEKLLRELYKGKC